MHLLKKYVMVLLDDHDVFLFNSVALRRAQGDT